MNRFTKLLYRQYSTSYSPESLAMRYSGESTFWSNLYWLGTIPSGVGLGSYVAYKTINEEKDSNLAVMTVKGASAGFLGMCAGVGLWLIYPVTIGAGVYSYYVKNNKK
jgi:hypothetical protein